VSGALPACAVDRHGQQQVSLRAIVSLAFPLFIHAGLQAVLNLTDTWFVGRISVEAVAGVGSVYWLILGLLLLLTGMGMGVQTVTAQAIGARRPRQAARAVWTGLWLALLTVVPFAMLVLAGGSLIPLLGLPDGVERAALDYWIPRFSGGPMSVALTAVLSFFMGIGQPRLALLVNGLVVLLNAVFNAWFIWGLGMGVAGVAWATTASVGCGLILAIVLFTSPRFERRYWSRHVWRPSWGRAIRLGALGFPIGLSIAFDILGLAAFQAMVARLGEIQGAATQIVMMLTSVAYMPAIGLGKAGTTLVGQSMGAGRPDWARRVGNRVIAITTIYMVLIAMVLALAGGELAALFMPASDPQAIQVIELAAWLAVIAAGYQVFDGLYIGSVFCLRGAGDTKIPAMLLLILSWGVFVPLTHFLAFAPGQGWWLAAPGMGLGAAGGWWAALCYIFLLAVALGWRWSCGSWQGRQRLEA
jgi:multidrug resistance protein, MATE family